MMMRGSRLDEGMTLVFMLLAIAAVVCYFAIDSRTPFLYCAGIAILVRLAQYFLRFIK
ncbi:MAG: hypothetical protein M0P33_00760 [Massilibacteroides sp.]|nr:hypothetical protein [Massilibacteroides sp.]